MAIRNLRINDDPILRKKSKQVKEMTDRTSELIDDLSESLKEFNGVGLAAVQVGVLKRIAIVNIPEFDEEGNEIETEDLVIVNPISITPLDDELQRGNEGCLSIPDKCAVVVRPNHILLKAYDRNLKEYELEAFGLLARAIQHECDHMDGILYIDKADGPIMNADEAQDEDEIIDPSNDDESSKE